MKIAYFSGSAIPSLTANSVQVMKMCQAMVQNGHDPTLYVVRGNDSVMLSGTDIWQHYGIEARFDIHRLKNIPNLRGYDVAIASALHASRKHVDLVFARNAVAAAITSTLGYRTIYELHQMPSGKLGPLWLRLIVSGKGFVRLITITEALRKAILAEYPGWLKGKEIIVAHDAVDLERFNNLPSPEEARARLGLFQGFTAGYSGSLYEGRGVELIFELAKSLPKVFFIMMGGSQVSVAEKKRQADNWGLRNVRFLGFIPNADLPIYLSACDVLLMPYQKHVAASGGGDISKVFSPIKLFEYMAMKRLIISSDLPVLREILNTGNAMLCACNSVVEWHTTIQKSIDNPDLRLSLADKARSDAGQYTWYNRVLACLSVF